MNASNRMVIYAKNHANEVVEIQKLEHTTSCIQALHLSCLRIISLPVDLSKFCQLTRLDLSLNKLTNLPNIVCLSSLECLNVHRNELTVLPELPEQLQSLVCGFNQLVKLPELPSALKYLYASNNQLKVLPKLPETLLFMNCEFNQLTQLPVFNEGMVDFDCSDNKLTRITQTPLSLRVLKCGNNQLISIKVSPDVEVFDFRNNPVCRVFRHHTRRHLDKRYKLQVIDGFNRTYYSGKLREFLFTRVVEPFVRRKYHPDRLRERLAEMTGDEDDEDAFHRALESW